MYDEDEEGNEIEVIQKNGRQVLNKLKCFRSIITKLIGNLDRFKSKE